MMVAAQAVHFVLRESHTLNVLQSRIHGLDHWWRVWKTSILLSAGDGHVDMEVVALYALFHDSMRMTDGEDRSHGMRGIRLWERWKDVSPPGYVDDIFSRNQEELLFEAIAEHSEGLQTTNPTIATCWDADRLDLHRKGLWPDTRFMSTQEGIALCMTRLNR
jgi:uncharacterized protein